MGRATRLTAAGRWQVAGVAALLWAMTTAWPVMAADEPAMTGPAGCRYRVPDGWPQRSLRWSGDCRDGLANGRGTLRAYDGPRVVLAFYGLVEGGQPVLGVVERPDGFVAGRFEAGRAVNDGERNTLILAFEEASRAAGQLAERYRKSGSAASARYYENKSRQLAQQMD